MRLLHLASNIHAHVCDAAKQGKSSMVVRSDETRTAAQCESRASLGSLCKADMERKEIRNPKP